MCTYDVLPACVNVTWLYLCLNNNSGRRGDGKYCLQHVLLQRLPSKHTKSSKKNNNKKKNPECLEAFKKNNWMPWLCMFPPQKEVAPIYMWNICQRASLLVDNHMTVLYGSTSPSSWVVKTVHCCLPGLFGEVVRVAIRDGYFISHEWFRIWIRASVERTELL